MKLKKMNLLLACFGALAIVSLSGCRKDDNSSISEPTTITLEKTSAKPNEIISVLTNKYPNENNTSVVFDNADLLFTIAGKHISFAVPDKPAGTYSVEVNTLSEKSNFSIQIVNVPAITDANAYITNVIDNNIQKFDAYRSYVDTLVSIGLLDAAEVNSRRQFWDNINTENQQLLAQMTNDEKAAYAKLYEANKDWIENITADLTGYVSFKNGSNSDCKAQMEEAIAYYNSVNGNLFRAMKAYWKAQQVAKCEVVEKTAKDKTTELGKAAHLVKVSDGAVGPGNNPLVLLVNQVSEFIDELKEEFKNVSKSPFVAEEVESAEKYKTQGTVEFCNGIGVKMYLKIRYRTIRASDADTKQPYSGFAEYYTNFINSYEAFVEVLTQPTLKNHMYVYRPSFVEATAVREMNRFLSIPKAGISNKKALLINTQFENNDNDWTVYFATDENSKQLFNFDIVYDDGLVKLTERLEGTVGSCSGYSLIGTRGPGGGIIFWAAAPESGPYFEVTDFDLSTNATFSQAVSLCENYTKNGTTEWFLPDDNIIADLAFQYRSSWFSSVNMSFPSSYWITAERVYELNPQTTINPDGETTIVGSYGGEDPSTQHRVRAVRFFDF